MKPLYMFRWALTNIKTLGVKAVIELFKKYHVAEDSAIMMLTSALRGRVIIVV